MGNTITVRLPPSLAAWLEQAAQKSGVSQGRIIRQELERAMNEQPGRPFLKLAGAVDGAKDLSSRKGFSSASRRRRR